jgi:hypothetical protein
VPILRRCRNCRALTPGYLCPNCKNTPSRRVHNSKAHQDRRKRLLQPGTRCHWCGQPATDVDYLMPIALGGAASDDNSVASCKSCNSRPGASVRPDPGTWIPGWHAGRGG